MRLFGNTGKGKIEELKCKRGGGKNHQAGFGRGGKKDNIVGG